MVPLGSRHYHHRHHTNTRKWERRTVSNTFCRESSPTMFHLSLLTARQRFMRGAVQVSHTCFFSVELPPYTTEERMRKGLLTAIHFGMGGILNA